MATFERLNSAIASFGSQEHQHRTFCDNSAIGQNPEVRLAAAPRCRRATFGPHDQSQVDAVVAAGGSPLQVIDFGIVPQILPAVAGISVYRWDINIRQSAIATRCCRSTACWFARYCMSTWLPKCMGRIEGLGRPDDDEMGTRAGEGNVAKLILQAIAGNEHDDAVFQSLEATDRV